MIESDRCESHDLNQEITSCVLCDLSKTRTNAVPGEGAESADIMFIGEGPGFNEDQQGRPFVGRAGKFLDQLIELIGLQRPDVFITNVVKCRPPDNRDPFPYELATCRPYLDRQIALVDPRVIVTLGRYSLGTFFPGDVIGRVHGTIREQNGRHFFAMYHPAAALHQERYKQTIIDDMKTLGQWLLMNSREPSAESVQRDDRIRPDEEPTQLALF